MDIINLVFGVGSIALGLFGWLGPKYTMETLNLRGHTDTMGRSEIRASAGALFVGMGLGAIILATPMAYAMLGFCWFGAAVGRLTSLIIDGKTVKKFAFFTIEAAVGGIALVGNL